MCVHVCTGQLSTVDVYKLTGLCWKYIVRIHTIVVSLYFQHHLIHHERSSIFFLFLWWNIVYCVSITLCLFFGEWTVPFFGTISIYCHHIFFPHHILLVDWRLMNEMSPTKFSLVPYIRLKWVRRDPDILCEGPAKMPPNSVVAYSQRCKLFVVLHALLPSLAFPFPLPHRHRYDTIPFFQRNQRRTAGLTAPKTIIMRISLSSSSSSSPSSLVGQSLKMTRWYCSNKTPHLRLHGTREIIESLKNSFIASTTRPLTSSMQIHQQLHRAVYCNVGSGIRSYSRTMTSPYSSSSSSSSSWRTYELLANGGNNNIFFRNSSTTCTHTLAAFPSSVFITPFQRTTRSFASSSPTVDTISTTNPLDDSSEAKDQVTSQDGSNKSTDEVAVKVEKVKVAACGDVDSDSDGDDDELEMEEMFVDAHPSFEHKMVEWGGPRRGGRFPEPTRYGDWERKGRCSDF